MLLMGKLTISMAIFNSYVKLPEGKLTHITWLTFGFGFTGYDQGEVNPSYLGWCVNPSYSYIMLYPSKTQTFTKWKTCINLSRFRSHPWTSSFRQRHLVGELRTQHRKEVHAPVNDHLDRKIHGENPRSSPKQQWAVFGIKCRVTYPAW